MSNKPQLDCEITEEMEEAFKKMKFSKDDFSNALRVKINTAEMKVELEETYSNTDLSKVADDLEESNPRFIVYSYKWVRADGRKQFPLVLIHYTPEGSSPVQNMMYTRMKTPLVTKWQLQRAIELREKEDLNDEWLLKHLMKA